MLGRYNSPILPRLLKSVSFRFIHIFLSIGLRPPLTFACTDRYFTRCIRAGVLTTYPPPISTIYISPFTSNHQHSRLCYDILMYFKSPYIFRSVGKLLSTVRLVSMPYLWYWYRIDPTDPRYEIQSMQ